MSKLVVKLNRQGVRELLQSQWAMDVCAEHAEATANALGDGYEVSSHRGQTRVNMSVGTATYEAMRDNYENNTLLRNLK